MSKISTVQKMDDVLYLTQKELAVRWKQSEGTIKNWRDRGILPYFRMPGSNRPLYPLDGIVDVENQHTVTLEELNTKSKFSKFKRKKPVVPVKTSDKNWRL